MTEELLVTTDGPIRTFTLNRPNRRNALTPSLAALLARQVSEAGQEPDVRLAVIRGAGGHFTVGLDLHWMAEFGASPSNDQIAEGLKSFQEAIHAVVRSPLPIVAGLQGSVAGFGVDLALACDMRYADDTVRFTSGFARIGLVPDGGSTDRLPHLIGPSRAFKFFVDGSTIDARYAQEIGLVDSVVDGALDEELQRLGGAVAQSSRGSIASIKYLIERHNGSGLTDTLAAEGREQLAALQGADFRQRLTAFVNGNVQ